MSVDQFCLFCIFLSLETHSRHSLVLLQIVETLAFRLVFLFSGMRKSASQTTGGPPRILSTPGRKAASSLPPPSNRHVLCPCSLSCLDFRGLLMDSLELTPAVRGDNIRLPVFPIGLQEHGSDLCVYQTQDQERSEAVLKVSMVQDLGCNLKSSRHLCQGLGFKS